MVAGAGWLLAAIAVLEMNSATTFLPAAPSARVEGGVCTLVAAGPCRVTPAGGTTRLFRPHCIAHLDSCHGDGSGMPACTPAGPCRVTTPGGRNAQNHTDSIAVFAEVTNCNNAFELQTCMHTYCRRLCQTAPAEGEIRGTAAHSLLLLWHHLSAPQRCTLVAGGTCYIEASGKGRIQHQRYWKSQSGS